MELAAPRLGLASGPCFLTEQRQKQAGGMEGRRQSPVEGGLEKGTNPSMPTHTPNKTE